MQFKTFATRDELAEALARHAARAVRKAISQKGAAVIAVSGGSTPEKLFKVLSATSLEWEKVTVTLVDERFVEPGNPRSNMGLVARLMLQDKAANARFLPLHDGTAQSPLEAAASADDKIRALGPIDVCILGMGTDGHTASFFPGGDRLAAVTDPAAERRVDTISAPGSIEERLTLTLPVILDAGLIVLHIEGESKRGVFEEARAGGSPEEMPVRSVLEHAGARLEVFWAP